MTRKERIRHNTKVLLPRLRNKTKPERKLVYEALRMGPFLWPIVVVMLGLHANPPPTK